MDHRTRLHDRHAIAPPAAPPAQATPPPAVYQFTDSHDHYMDCIAKGLRTMHRVADAIEAPVKRSGDHLCEAQLKAILDAVSQASLVAMAAGNHVRLPSQGF